MNGPNTCAHYLFIFSKDYSNNDTAVNSTSHCTDTKQSQINADKRWNFHENKHWNVHRHKATTNGR